MKISEIYNKMIAENLSYSQIVAQLDPPITIQGLRYHVAKHCKKNSLPLPSGKRGRKEVVKNFKLKGE
jgi:hypothetical protein